MAGAQRHVAERLAAYDVAHRPAVAANVDQAVMILKMLRPKTDIRRAKQRVTSLDAASHRTQLTTLSAMLIASITDSVVQFAVDTVDKLGLVGVFLLMVAESACLPIPSEATMLFAGFNVSEGEYSLIVVTLVGVAGNLVGSWIAYGVGYFGRVDLIEKHGHKVLIKQHHLDMADDWFARYGSWTVFFARLLPIVRTFISLPAGVARMPFWRFTILTVAGCLPWVFALAFIGKQAGDNWEKWKEHLHYVDYVVIVAILAAIVWLFVRWRQRRAAATAT